MKLIQSKKFFLYLGLILYIIFNPISISIRQIGLGILILVIIVDLLSDYRNLSLNVKELIDSESLLVLLMLAYFALNTFFISINFDNSFEVFTNSVWQCFSLYFIISYYLKNNVVSVKWILWLIVISAFIQGVDGIYQYFIGVDFIKGDPAWGTRLTASLDTPRVGNFISLCLPAFLILFYQLRIKNKLLKIFFFVFIVFPPFFLLIFSQTRSGWTGFAAFLVVFLLLDLSKRYFYAFALFLIPLVFFENIILKRLEFSKILNDSRWELWDIGLKLFSKKPLTGHGIATFSEAFNYYGFIPTQSTKHIPHPHNIYVQFLCETGIIGFILFFAIVVKRFYTLVKKYKNKYSDNFITSVNIAWITSYLVTAATAHSFFRTWWLGSFMLVFAVTSETVSERWGHN
ncbi:O-antigen polymerase [Flexistipes sinusarabici DSM 4947]|uniref:O-antigen polymerase n=1 Tax=Flexistipes sinusarabici (strain ATCC 49648 / DSM 4947 / MAS 10) TaxID=717231 RepID=F8E825_FLESM|nr:O-antigen ligase family protein [Flexistipes sinusarabici]AEI13949.1 O-antigen polymerase [Flexistipes sinusarabici DSM 4947]